MEIKCLSRHHADFPDSLRQIPDPPEQIYVLGNINALASGPKLAVVGSRKVTPYGKLVTLQLAGQAAERGITIVSGLALGVDGLGHQAALDAQGLTIAVLAGGLDDITPVTNYWLGQKILEQGGAIISEYPPGMPPIKINFVARNRLVAGLSDAVLITEAAAKSGSLHTAAFALDQGKTILAVPGNINAPISEGTNNLLKTIAAPATDIQDILLALGLSNTSNRPRPTADNPEEAIIISLLEAGIADISTLLEQSQLSAPAFNQTLTMLEITGKIQALGGGQWALK